MRLLEWVKKCVLYLKVGNQFKKKDDICLGYNDWYNQHSWFDRKWFKHKLKRLIMGNVYKFIDKLDDILFEKYHETYYVNFKIYVDRHGLKIFELPLIIKIKYDENIEYVTELIKEEIKKVFGFPLCGNENPIKVIDNEQLNIIKKDIGKKFLTYTGIGKIKFNTIRFHQFNHKLIEFLPLTIKEEDISLGYKMLNIQDIEFGVINVKNEKQLIDKSFQYQIFIQFDKVVKDAIDDEPKEIRIDRIKELMGLKIDNVNDKTE